MTCSYCHTIPCEYEHEPHFYDTIIDDGPYLGNQDPMTLAKAWAEREQYEDSKTYD